MGLHYYANMIIYTRNKERNRRKGGMIRKNRQRPRGSGIAPRVKRKKRDLNIENKIASARPMTVATKKHLKQGNEMKKTVSAKTGILHYRNCFLSVSPCVQAEKKRLYTRGNDPCKKKKEGREKHVDYTLQCAER